MDRQLNIFIYTRSPFRLLPAFWQPAFQCTEIMIFVDIVFAILEDLHLVAFAICRRSGIEDFTIDLVDFLLELLNPIIDCFLFLTLRLVGGEAYVNRNIPFS